MRRGWTLYDALGRPFSTTLPDGSTAWLDFNSRGLIAETYDVDGLTTTYSHDALGRVTSELRTGLRTSPSYTYDAAGRVVAAADRDGVASTVTYTRSGLVQSMARDPLPRRTRNAREQGQGARPARGLWPAR